MKIRKRLIALLVLLAFVVAGCSATPKFTKIAGTVLNENGRPMPKVGVIIGSSLAQTNSAGQFTLQAPSQEKQATLLINGYRPQTLPLNLGGESQAIILTAKPAKPTRRSGSEVDYILPSIPLKGKVLPLPRLLPTWQAMMPKKPLDSMPASLTLTKPLNI